MYLNKLIIALLTTLVISSCGLVEGQTQVDNFMFESSDPMFDHYKKLYEEDYEKTIGLRISVGYIRINLVDDLGVTGRVAECRLWGSKREILIRRDWWNSPIVEEEHREKLLYHELGHCHLNRGHNNKTINGAEVSVMHQHIHLNQNFGKYREEYVRELFKKDERLITKMLQGY